MICWTFCTNYYTINEIIVYVMVVRQIKKLAMHYALGFDQPGVHGSCIINTKYDLHRIMPFPVGFSFAILNALCSFESIDLNS